MIHQGADISGISLFGDAAGSIMAYPSLSIGLNIGLHFGN